MKKSFTILFALLILLSLCYGCKSNPDKTEATGESENVFLYKDTKWGMTLDEIIALKGEPHGRNDEPKDDGTGSAGDENVNTESDSTSDQNGDLEQAEDNALLIDLHYVEQNLFDKYSVNEIYQFDKDNLLEGVVVDFNLGKLNEDLTNMDELKNIAYDTYNNLKDMLIREHGEPAAEYTAYKDGDEYKTQEILDFQKENSVVHASRWDGDNYRFVYIMYYPNQLLLEMHFITHDKETIERVDSEKAAS